jgi:protein-disulfide isomerase
MVWKDFPLTSIHPQAFKASEAAHCAGDQGKYWEFHDRLFANQQALQVDSLKKHAADLGLDIAAFSTCLDTGKHAGKVRSGLQAGAALGVASTPSVFINGRLVTGAQPYEAFQAIIDDELRRAGER